LRIAYPVKPFKKVTGEVIVETFEKVTLVS
jgi:hypothetical protein